MKLQNGLHSKVFPGKSDLELIGKSISIEAANSLRPQAAAFSPILEKEPAALKTPTNFLSGKQIGLFNLFSQTVVHLSKNLLLACLRN